MRKPLRHIKSDPFSEHSIKRIGTGFTIFRMVEFASRKDFESGTTGSPNIQARIDTRSFQMAGFRTSTRRNGFLLGTTHFIRSWFSKEIT
jgi:hypothetical protein